RGGQVGSIPLRAPLRRRRVISGPWLCRSFALRRCLDALDGALSGRRLAAALRRSALGASGSERPSWRPLRGWAKALPLYSELCSSE
ncbi:unnamed protein product, partial [Polarella glacialis]